MGQLMREKVSPNDNIVIGAMRLIAVGHCRLWGLILYDGPETTQSHLQYYPHVD